MMTMLITALGTATSFAALASDELDISSCTMTKTAADYIEDQIADDEKVSDASEHVNISPYCFPNGFLYCSRPVHRAL